MNLFEYQGKALFASAGIPVPQGAVIRSSKDIPEFKEGRVIKAQVLTGGRGKAGAIKKCETVSEIPNAIAEVLSMKVKEHRVNCVLVEELCKAREEYYFSISVNRKNKLFTLMFSNQGGMDIESVSPEKLTFVDVNPLIGLRPYMVKELLLPFALDKKEELTDLIEKAYALFVREKMQLLEINPVALTVDDKIVALDAKVTLDDNYLTGSVALDVNESGDLTPFEGRVARYGATGVELSGDIAVVCAGAGVSMATADSIIRKGGSVRLIMDIGILESDSNDEEKRRRASEVYALVANLNPRVILFNDFYQAGRLDNEAKTIRYAMEKVAERIPVIFRCKGRGAEEAREYLRDTAIYMTDSYGEACDMAIRAAKEGKVWLS